MVITTLLHTKSAERTFKAGVGLWRLPDARDEHAQALIRETRRDLLEQVLRHHFRRAVAALERGQLVEVAIVQAAHDVLDGLLQQADVAQRAVGAQRRAP